MFLNYCTHQHQIRMEWALSCIRNLGIRWWRLNHTNNRFMAIKLVVGDITLNVVGAYAPQAGLEEEVKKQFWDELDELVM